MCAPTAASQRTRETDTLAAVRFPMDVDVENSKILLGRENGQHLRSLLERAIDSHRFSEEPDLADGLVPGWLGARPDAIHASPPCKRFTVASKVHGKGDEHVDLLTPARALLASIGLPYVIENVPGAPMCNPIQCCGSAVGLRVRRHRLFESNFPMMGMQCRHAEQGRVVGVYGDGGALDAQGARRRRREGRRRRGRRSARHRLDDLPARAGASDPAGRRVSRSGLARRAQPRQAPAAPGPSAAPGDR